ncbi:hypothetical protein CEE45_06915 [Candidatus Heimdallarchaeota archaeon B3_Heim]|nr:MAG: hypothetical protein CEE45_06915 [Candidatus Heimdallarchaeota archaeon B3_Heim]
MAVQLETNNNGSFLSSLLQMGPHFESFLRLVLKTSSFVRTQDEFSLHVQSLWQKYLGKLVDPVFSTKIIRLLRLTGLLKRKYYQRSVLGTFLLAYNLNIFVYLQVFHTDLSFMLDRHQTPKVSLKKFQPLLLSYSKWYINILQHEYSGWKLQVFQDVFCLAFDWYSDKDCLKAAVRPLLKDHLKILYQQFESTRKARRKTRSIPIHQSTKEPFIFPKIQHGERGLVLVKVLTEIYDWITAYTSKKDENFTKNYDPPFFDILIHAKKARVTYRDEEGDIDIVKAVPIPQYTRAVTWILKREITRREKIFLTKTVSLQQIDKLGIKALELITLIRKHLVMKYIKICPNKKRRVLAFNFTSKLIDRPLGQQRKMLDFTCGCCKYLGTYTKIDCLFFKKLEYLVSLGYITIPDYLKSLYVDRIKPIFSTKVACPFLKLKKDFPLQLSVIRGEKLSCAFCQTPLETVPVSKSPVLCQCTALYSFISSKMTGNNVYHCQFTDQQLNLSEHGKHEIYINTLVEQDYKRIEKPKLKKEQVFQTQSSKIKRFSKKRTGYIYIHESDTIYYAQGQKQLLVNQIAYHTASLNLVDTEKWNLTLQNTANNNPHLEFNYRPDNTNLAREDKVTLVTDRIPILQIKRPRKKEVETYPLQQLRTVYNVGKPRLNKVFKKWGVEVIHSSVKGVLKEPTEEIKEAMQLPGVRRTLQQLHVQGLMVSLMNATYYLMKLALLYEKKWLADRYHYWMNNLLLQCPTKLENYYQDASVKSFRQVSVLEAWFSRPFAEGVRKFVQIIQDQNHPLVQRPYGRAVARRVNKEEKQGVDYMGGYTAYDAALNCVNRRLRHQLRIWNAKRGLGFHTIPLFVHTAKDNPGRAGHLDLEEVGRILSRLTLCEAIAEEQISPFSFQRRYDDDTLPYYVPKEQLIRWLRGVLVKKGIFPKKLFYNDQWMTFERAHKWHVQHLCSCLERALDYTDYTSRRMFLQSSYQPLIFIPDFAEFESRVG